MTSSKSRTVTLDEHDLKMIRTSLCYFDMYESGDYDEWFGKDADHANDSFHYLYSLTDEVK